VGFCDLSAASQGHDVTERAFGGAMNKRTSGRCIVPATPASWSRYIDSRMKQFCAR